MFQKYSKWLGNGNIKDSYMILSKHIQPKQDVKQPSIEVTLNVHVIKRRGLIRKFMTMESHYIKVVKGRSKSKPQRLKSLPSRKARMLIKKTKSEYLMTMFQ